MKIKIMLDEGAKMPTRAHETDAGLDLYTPIDVEVPKTRIRVGYSNYAVGVGSAIIDTGVHLAIPVGYVGLLKSKSGLMVRAELTTDGTIDSGYTGSIRVKLFNHGSYDFKFKAGEKIAQLVLLPIITPDLVEVDSLEETERGDGGFGSTGK